MTVAVGFEADDGESTFRGPPSLSQEGATFDPDEIAQGVFARPAIKEKEKSGVTGKTVIFQGSTVMFSAEITSVSFPVRGGNDG